MGHQGHDSLIFTASLVPCNLYDYRENQSSKETHLINYKKYFSTPVVNTLTLSQVFMYFIKTWRQDYSATMSVNIGGRNRTRLLRLGHIGPKT